MRGERESPFLFFLFFFGLLLPAVLYTGYLHLASGWSFGAGHIWLGPRTKNWVNELPALVGKACSRVHVCFFFFFPCWLACANGLF